MKTVSRAFLSTCLASVAMFGASNALADDTLRRPLDRPDYDVEVEPHGTIGVSPLYAAAGVGAGVRLSIPIAREGFLPKVNDSVAISFGGDILHYSGCVYKSCGANYVVAPVTMQWNFFVHRNWSFMAEPGVAAYYGFFDDPCINVTPCTTHTRAGIVPAGFVGARFHTSDHVAITARVGYPTMSLGVSFQ